MKGLKVEKISTKMVSAFFFLKPSMLDIKSFLSVGLYEFTSICFRRIVLKCTFSGAI